MEHYVSSEILMVLILFIVLVSGIIRTVFIRDSSEIVGKIGEKAVSTALSRLDANIYHVMNDIMIPDGYGGTTQIDHIIISPYGIFVIETKNISGWIFGETKSAKWCSSYYGDRYYFQNPFHQNYKHICCLSQIMDLPKSPFITIVAFTGNCKIKTRDMLPASFVTSGYELLSFILNHKTELLEKSLVESLETRIRQSAIVQDKKSVASHVSYVRKQNRHY